MEAKQEEKIDETEMSDVSSSSDEAVEEYLKRLSVQKQPQTPPIRPNVPQNVQTRRPQNQYQATVAQPAPRKVSWADRHTPTPHRANPYYRKAAMPNPPARPPRGLRKAKMTFRSHYGPGGEYLDTRDKARLLYTNCFG